MSDSEIGAEFDCLMRRAGITIPEGRRPAILVYATELRRLAALLHTAHPASLEPALVFQAPPREPD